MLDSGNLYTCCVLYRRNVLKYLETFIMTFLLYRPPLILNKLVILLSVSTKKHTFTRSGERKKKKKRKKKIIDELLTYLSIILLQFRGSPWKLEHMQFFFKCHPPPKKMLSALEMGWSISDTVEAGSGTSGIENERVVTPAGCLTAEAKSFPFPRPF